MGARRGRSSIAECLAVTVVLGSFLIGASAAPSLAGPTQLAQSGPTEKRREVEKKREEMRRAKEAEARRKREAEARKAAEAERKNRAAEERRRRAARLNRVNFAAVKRILSKRWGFSLMNDKSRSRVSVRTPRKGNQHPCLLFANIGVNYTCSYGSGIKRHVARFGLRGYGLYLRCPHYTARSGRLILAFLKLNHLQVHNQQHLRRCGTQEELILYWKVWNADD